MGEPVKIRDLAEQMIRFYGYEPGRDIQIAYTGLRPGERLDEKLWADNELPQATAFDRILRLEKQGKTDTDIRALMAELAPVCRLDPEKSSRYRNAGLLREILGAYIPSYAASLNIKAPEDARD
jgi:FlaA1/EpsC-like NDP-sugar epimerase